VYARGAFHSQLKQLETQLPAQEAGEIRVLLLHHSALYKPANGSKDLTMRSRSRKALDSFLVNYGISVLMCGHTHAAEIKVFTATASNGLSRDIVECRCGTTTQRDRIPSSLRTPTGGFPNWTLDPNTLIVHWFEAAPNNHVVLMSKPYVLVSTGFTPYGKPSRNVVTTSVNVP
jgi:hypothetical protein